MTENRRQQTMATDESGDHHSRIDRRSAPSDTEQGAPFDICNGGHLRAMRAATITAVSIQGAPFDICNGGHLRAMRAAHPDTEQERRPMRAAHPDTERQQLTVATADKAHR